RCGRVRKLGPRDDWMQKGWPEPALSAPGRRPLLLSVASSKFPLGILNLVDVAIAMLPCRAAPRLSGYDWIRLRTQYATAQESDSWVLNFSRCTWRLKF